MASPEVAAALGAGPLSEAPLSEALPDGLSVELCEGLTETLPVSKLTQVSGRVVTEALDDSVAAEEPLEIRVGGSPFAVVMRTPGHDIELCTGFALTERLFPSLTDIRSVHHASQTDSDNVVVIHPNSGTHFDIERLRRNLYASSSCGVCGKRTIDEALSEAPALASRTTLNEQLVLGLPSRLREFQPGFSRTGGLHAAGLFDQLGAALVVREDIGRHNAVDKVVGFAARSGVDLTRVILVVSGRCSFEIVQKALAVRIGAIVSVGAASTLAVRLALRANLTLYGFVASDRATHYTSAPDAVPHSRTEDTL